MKNRLIGIPVPVLSLPEEPNHGLMMIFSPWIRGTGAKGIRTMLGFNGKYTPPEKPPEPPGGGTNITRLSDYRKQREASVRAAQSLATNNVKPLRKVA